MNVLALEFSSPQRSVAVVCATEGTVERRVEMIETGGPASHAFSMIDSALREAGIEREQIGCLAVGLGPGSYTGIRAAIAIAQGWQLATGVNIRGLGSMPVLAEAARLNQRFGVVNFVIDAQRQEVYVSQWRIEPDSAVEVEPVRLTNLPEIQRRSERGEVLTGPEITRWLPSARLAYPRAVVLGSLALREGGNLRGEELEPVYLRPTTFVKAPAPRFHVNLSPSES